MPSAADSAVNDGKCQYPTDSAGSPVIWEILADESGLDLVFVAESLEAAAKKEWGELQVGRRFGSERDPRGVSTLVCRCMPAQARSLLNSSVYQLKTIQAENSDLLLKMLRDRLKFRAAFWPGETDISGLQKKLRLPNSF
jgi:hypothetical protein